MAKSDPSANEFLFDVRLQARHLTKQLIDAKGLSAYLESLPDLANEVDAINVQQLTTNAAARRRRGEGETPAS